MKKFRIRLMLSPTKGREKWLNKMAANGYRLTGTSRMHRYSFEPCSPGEYLYRVEFAADKSNKELKDYRQFLSGLGIRSFPQSSALGRYSIGQVRLRWFGGTRLTAATSPGNLNSESLILEKKNDGKPFEIYSDLSGQIACQRNIRNAQIVYVLFFLAFLFLNLHPENPAEANVPVSVLCAILALFPAVGTVRNSLDLHRLKEENITHE
jgi:hypothetical protein